MDLGSRPKRAAMGTEDGRGPKNIAFLYLQRKEGVGKKTFKADNRKGL